MSKQIVSIYTFDLNDNTAEQDLFSASAKLDKVLLDLRGFLYRSLTKTIDGVWQDIVYWDSEEDLNRADSIESHADFAEFMALINSSTVKNIKAVVHSSVYPEMQTAEPLTA